MPIIPLIIAAGALGIVGGAYAIGGSQGSQNQTTINNSLLDGSTALIIAGVGVGAAYYATKVAK